MDPLFLTIALVLLPVAHLFGFAGCTTFTSEDPPPKPPDPPPTPTPTPTPPPEPPKYDAVILAEPGLVSYWRLGETAGIVAKDSAPDMPRDGEYKEPQAITLGEAGALIARDPADKAPRFQGTAGRMDAPYHMLLNPPLTFSLEVWIKPELTNPGNRAAAVGGLFDVDVNSAAVRGYALTVLYPSLEIRAELGLNKLAPANVLPAGYPVRLTLGNDGGWKHIVLTVNITPASIEMKLYLNGSTSQGVTIDRTQFDYKNDFTTTPFRIGAGWAPQAPSAIPFYFFNGRIDEVAFYNKTLDAATVLKHYQASLPKA